MPHAASAQGVEQAGLSALLHSLRVGNGYDAHRFAAAGSERPLWLAGLLWQGEGEGLVGDSDGDVAIHAMIDAMLTATHSEDIGAVFGVRSKHDAQAENAIRVSSASYATATLSAANAAHATEYAADAAHTESLTSDLRGVAMLSAVTRLLRERGWQFLNISVVIVANRPHVSKRRMEAQECLSRAAGCVVSVSATTTDGMGFTGSSEGAAAYATALACRIDASRSS